jgi:hypothetical protein
MGVMLAEVRWPATRRWLLDGHGTAVRSWGKESALGTSSVRAPPSVHGGSANEPMV